MDKVKRYNYSYMDMPILESCGTNPRTTKVHSWWYV